MAIGETALYQARVKEIPPLPHSLIPLDSISHVNEGAIEESILPLFPYLSKASPLETLRVSPLRVGVVLSGGQAPGGHNVICGLMTALKQLNSNSKLFGFLDGPSGIIENNIIELTPEITRLYLNTGGFDMIGSGRTKIETPEQFEASLKTIQDNKLDALVIIGGDDSNTNAALLAEYFLSHHQNTTVVGVPKTIDGDLKSSFIEQSFGFDTATKVYSETIGNILKDVISAKKYWFFIRLMGRSASHITLEAALQTHPNLTLISEERRELETIVKDISSLISERAAIGKNYGAILIPEGMIEFIPSLSPEVFEGMPVSYDSHGNLEVSKIETEKFLIELVKKQLDPSVSFSPVTQFLGYEGRSAFPTYFDSCYTYALGHVAALLVSKGATGQMAIVTSLKKSVAEWGYKGLPLISLLHREERKGVYKPVIKKALVDIESLTYRQFKKDSACFRLQDDYRSPGPIQFWGPTNVVDSRSISL